MPPAGRTSPLSNQVFGLRLFRNERSLVGKNTWVINFLSHRDRVLWLRHPNLKKWTLENTFSLALRSPTVKPPNSLLAPDKSIPPLHLLPNPCTGVLTADKEPHIPFLQPTMTSYSFPTSALFVVGYCILMAGFCCYFVWGRGVSQSLTYTRLARKS